MVRADISYEQLKERQRGIREGFPQSLSLRVHRAISWIGRVEQANGDPDASFIFYWIAFNAAYAREIRDAVEDGQSERQAFEAFFRQITSLDHDRRIYNAIWQRFSQSIRILLDNRFVFMPFWKHQNGIPEYADWELRFENAQRRIQRALQEVDTPLVLAILFDRLYVLRNQLVHGGATWNSSVNRNQVNDGARVLAFLVPLFVDLMMDSPSADWGPPYYPVVTDSV